MSGHTPTAYAHVVTDDGKVVLEYWFDDVSTTLQ